MPHDPHSDDSAGEPKPDTLQAKQAAYANFSQGIGQPIVSVPIRRPWPKSTRLSRPLETDLRKADEEP